MRQIGFTLIELMIAISIIAILGALGIVGFSNFNKAQVLQTSAKEVIAMLNLAKSRAQSQIKPLAFCSGGSLSGYKVIISNLKKYSLYLSCSTGVDSLITEQDKSLPTGLNFSEDSSLSFFFPVRSGGIQASGLSPWQIIILDNDGKTKTITINPGGNVQ
jgi:prepilin-type N-terminal cleavage/methylation domain-containing protein